MRKISFIVILLVSVLIINNLVRSIYGLWQKHALIEEAKEELVLEKKKYAALSDEMDVVSEPFFLEEEARNKLFLVKPGEEVVIVPRVPEDTIRSTKKIRAKAVWQQWVEYFGFGS